MKQNILISTLLIIFVVGLVSGVYQEPECAAAGGTCKLATDCSSGTTLSGKCPTQPTNVKCCVQGCTGTCSSTAKTLACQILNLQTIGKIVLKPNHFSSLGNNPYDGAAALDNIKDTCAGKMAKRSRYENAPGGCVCLKPQVLQVMFDYAVAFFTKYAKPIQVNSIAGSSHTANSWHYQGNTMDVACTTPVNHCTALKNFCSSRAARELCYPGSSCGGHETWVHCSWTNLS